MHRIWLWAGMMFAWWFASAGLVASEDLPSIEELTKAKQAPADEAAKTGTEEKAHFPRKLDVEETNLEASALLPPDPYFYLETGNGQGAGTAMDGTAVAALLAEKRIDKFLRENPMTLVNLFVDLPERYSNADGLNLYGGGADFARAFARVDSRVVLAAYPGGGRGLLFVFLADIGRDRQAPFETLGALRDEFLNRAPQFALEESPRGDDCIDVLRAEDEKGELAFGIVRNYLVVCSNAAFAKNLIRVAAAGGGQKTLKQSPAFQEIARRTDSNALVRGFVDLRSLLLEAHANQLPGATEMLDFGCDLAGRGVLYYDLRVDGQRLIEHVVSPTQVRVEENEVRGVPARVLEVCTEPAGDKAWNTAKVLPYQPDIYIAARVKPEAFAELLLSPQPLGKSEYAAQIAASIPTVLRDREGVLSLLKPGIDQALEGEVALALLPPHEGARPWIFVLSVLDVAAAKKLLDAREAAETVGDLKIYSLAQDKWQAQPCWTLLSQTVFQNLGTPQIVIASSGELMQTIIDQATAVAASLAENKDFVGQLAAAGKQNSVVWYYNLPALVSREYVNLPNHVKAYFPSLTSVSNRPPMSLVTKHITGIAGGVEPRAGELACRSTIVSPCTTIPSLAGILTVNMPRWIRERARLYLRDSRENLGQIWLSLQTYATQRGHFPDSMEELRGLFSRPMQRRIFVAMAAVEQKGLEEAARNSYTYVLGVRPTDEPDRPILYESGPWHHEYRGMMDVKGAEPSETGPYLQWRLVLTLDGTIRAYSEDEFQKSVLPRLKLTE